MENHPIPQDITGFQFKLIGDMTLKQFAYLAGGCIIAWIIFSLPITYFVKFPFASLLVLSGISLAFLSMEGRPMDTMIVNFMRATFSPTKYVYQNPKLSLSQVSTNPKIQEVNFPTPIKTGTASEKAPENDLDKKEFDFFHMLSQMLHPVHNQSKSVSHANADDGSVSAPYIVTAQVQGEKKEMHHHNQSENPSEKEEESEIEKLDEETQALKEELKAAVKEEKANKGSPTYEDVHKKALEIEQVLNETLSQKQNLEKQILELKKQLDMQKGETYAPSSAPLTKTPNVRTITSKAQAKTAGLPTMPEFPNIVTGIVKDPRENPLANILVEVKDSEGNPVRAFKTNPLGQFGASTPLSNGDYTIEFEDSKGMNKFDKIAFTAAGEIIPPIEIFSIDPREELRKTLFN